MCWFVHVRKTVNPDFCKKVKFFKNWVYYNFVGNN